MIKYRADIDGLRAVAVIAVIIFHLNPSLLKGGFVGVDVFFVISGFLITSILLKDVENKSFNIYNFWKKRAKRLTPAFLVLILVLLIYSFFVVHFGHWPSIALQSITSLLGIANFEMWKHAGNYWAGNGDNMPLLHMWSLAVEEQYYLIYPMLLYIGYRSFKGKAVYALILLIILSFILMMYVEEKDSKLAFYMFPTRAWELGVGGLIAFFPSFKARKIWIINIVQVLSLGLIILSFFIIDSDNFFNLWILLPVLATAALIYSSDKESYIAQILSCRWIVQIGKYSYSLYLWHWPIIVFAHQYALEKEQDFPYLIVITLIVIASLISYYMVEQKFRFMNNVVIYKSMSCLFVLSLATSFWLFKYTPYNLESFKPVIWNGELYSNNANPKKGIMDRAKYRGVQRPWKDKSLAQSYKNGGILKTYGDGKVDIVVLGSSHGQMWSSPINQIAEELKLDVSFYSAGGVSGIFNYQPAVKKRFDYQYQFDKARYTYIKQWKPRVVFILEKWSSVYSTEQEILNFINFLNPSKVVFLSETPYFREGKIGSLKFLAAYTDNKNLSLNLKPEPSVQGQKMNAIIKSFSQKIENCFFLDLNDIFYSQEDKGKGIFVENGHLLYIDAHHLSDYGAMKGKGRIKQLVEDLMHEE